jgi:hypothetical protein
VGGPLSSLGRPPLNASIVDARQWASTLLCIGPVSSKERRDPRLPLRRSSDEVAALGLVLVQNANEEQYLEHFQVQMREILKAARDLDKPIVF